MTTITRQINNSILSLVLVDENTLTFGLETKDELYEKVIVEEKMGKALQHLFSQGSIIIVSDDKSANVSVDICGNKIEYTLDNVDPPTIVENGRRMWKKDGKFHREGDRPADIRSNGDKYWYKEGVQHRDGDEPAVVHPDGRKMWIKEGKQHRDGDEPAEIHPDGYKMWVKEGKTHRDGDEPAEIYANGSKLWYKDGKRHRDNDKPASVWASGARSWWRNGERHRDGDEFAYLDDDGHKHWYKNNKLHRDNNQPAIVKADGTKEWYVNGVKIDDPNKKKESDISSEYKKRQNAIHQLVKFLDNIENYNDQVEFWKCFFMNHGLTYPDGKVTDPVKEFKIQTIMARLGYEVDSFTGTMSNLKFDYVKIHEVLKLLNKNVTVFEYTSEIVEMTTEECLRKLNSNLGGDLYMGQKAVSINIGPMTLFIALNAEERLSFLHQALGTSLKYTWAI